MSHLRVVKESSYEAPVWRHRDMRGHAALLIFLMTLLVLCIGIAIISNYENVSAVDPAVYLGVAVVGAAIVTWFYLKLCEALDPSNLT